MRIAVIGATGNFGRPVTKKLLESGYKVRAVTRSADKARKRLGDKIEIAESDLTNLEEVIAALRACDAVHLNLNLDRVSSKDAAAWPGYRNIVDSARVNDVARISYIEGDPPLDEEHDFSCDPELFGGAKLIAQSGLPYTIFNPTWFMESLPWFIENGRAIVPGNQRHKYHWLAAADYADMVARAIVMPECANKILWICGPEAYSIPDALSLWCVDMLPGVLVEEIPIKEHRKVAPNDTAWQRYMDLMAVMERTGEIGDPTEANKLLGAPKTTLRDFIRAQSA